MARHSPDNRILAGGTGTVVSVSEGGTTQGPIPPSFILMPNGEMPRSIADVAQIPTLATCTLDMWAGGKHRRATRVSWTPMDNKLIMNTPDPIMRRISNKWERDRLANFNYFLLSPQGYCVPSHAPDRLLFYAVSHQLPSGSDVQFALYPTDYELGPGRLQVTHWLNPLSPAFGTPDW